MLSLFWYALLCVCVLSSFAIILKRKRELLALLLLSYGCCVTVNVMWLFLRVPRVGLQCVIVVLSGHTHLIFMRCLLFNHVSLCGVCDQQSLRSACAYAQSD